MTFYKEISESHDTIKSIGLSTLVSPFWFLSLFLFNHNFYNNSDLVIKIILCLLLSMSSVIVLSVFAFNVNKSKYNLVQNVSVSIFILIIWKAILIFSIYSICFFFQVQLYFYWYILIYFIPLVIISILSFFEKIKSRIQ